MWYFVVMFLKVSEFENLCGEGVSNLFLASCLLWTILKQEFLTNCLRIHYLLAMKQGRNPDFSIDSKCISKPDSADLFSQQKKSSENSPVKKYDRALKGVILFNEQAILNEYQKLNSVSVSGRFELSEKSTLHSLLRVSKRGRILQAFLALVFCSHIKSDV